MTDLTGRKVRLIGPYWNGLTDHREGAIRTAIEMTESGRGVVLDGRGGPLGFPHGGIWGVEVLPPRERVLVYVFADADQAALDWVVPDRDPGSEAHLRARFNADRFDEVHERGVFARLSVAGYAPDDAGRRRVDDLITSLGDEILAGRLGKIIDRY